MNEDIIKILKTVNYPGYSRDIISFGILESIKIENFTINLNLKLNAEDKTKDEIQNNIHLALKDNFPKFKISISYIDSNNKIDISSNISALKNVKHIIAIASSKGGVGKSTTAVNLAATLAKTNKVGILDLDIYGPSLPTALGIHEKPKLNSENFLLPIEKYNMKLMSFGFLND